MSNNLKIGLVGAGNVASHHVLAWQQTDGAEPVAVCRRDETKLKEFAQKFDLDWVTDYHILFKNPDLDVIDIVLPSGQHAVVGIEAARAGKHVLVEKPIDVTLKNADDLIAACRDNGVTLGVISQYRFMDGSQKMYAALAHNKLGQLVQGDAYIKWFRPQAYYDSGAWRGTWALDGGGPFMNQGIHLIDLLLSVMGPIKSVYARTKTLAHKIEVEDIGVAMLEFENGAFGVIEASTAIWPGLPARLDIHGTKGSLTIEGDELTFFHVEGEDAITSADVDTGGASDPTDIDVAPFVRQFTDFVDSVRTGRQPRVSGEQARKPLELILAIYESSKKAAIVHLNQ